jgi:transposase
MGEVSVIGLDLAKNVFQAHGADLLGAVVFRKRLRRAQLLGFSRVSRPVRSPWRRAQALTIGGARSASLVMP